MARPKGTDELNSCNKTRSLDPQLLSLIRPKKPEETHMECERERREERKRERERERERERSTVWLRKINSRMAHSEIDKNIYT